MPIILPLINGNGVYRDGYKKKQLPVHVDVHILPKIFVAVKTEAHEGLGGVADVRRKKHIFQGRRRASNIKTATLNDAVIKYVSSSRVRPVGNHSSVVL